MTGGRGLGAMWAWFWGEGGVAGEGARCGGCGRSEGGGGGSHGRETRGEVRGGPVDNRVLGGGPGTLGGGGRGAWGESRIRCHMRGGIQPPGGVRWRIGWGGVLRHLGGIQGYWGGVLRSGGVLGWKGEGGQDPLLSGGETESMRGS